MEYKIDDKMLNASVFLTLLFIDLAIIGPT